MIEPPTRPAAYSRWILAGGTGCIVGTVEPVLAGPVVAAADYHQVLPSKASTTAKSCDRPYGSSSTVTSPRRHGLPFCTRSPAQIDTVNILQATLEAMCAAAKSLQVPPDFVLLDDR